MNASLYRAAFLVLVLPLLAAAFTVDRPAPLPAPALPPAFDAKVAVQLARDLATRYPNRTPGSSGGLGAAAWFREQLTPYGLRTRTASWSEDVPGLGSVRLQNVIAVVPGKSPDTIVFTAHRDDTGAGPGANDNASGTAALVELARAYASPSSESQPGVRSTHTLVFLSTDGGAFGGLGAARFASLSPLAGRAVAVVNLDGLAGSGPARVEIAGDRPRSPRQLFLLTAARRILEQTGDRPRHAGFLGQLVDLGFPFTLYGQGPFLAHGISAITLTSSDVRPPSPFEDSAATLRPRTLATLGRAAQELLGSLDVDLELTPGTTSYVWFGDRVLRGWAIELVLISLLVPFLVASVDLFALCRRHRVPLGPAARALASRLGFWLFVGAVFTCFRLLGAWPGGPARPPNPESAAAGDWRLLPLTAFLLLVAAGWLLGRRRLLPTRAVDPAEVVAGQTTALLALAVVALLVVATNPFALLFVLPAAHLWLWLPRLHAAPAAARLLLFAAGLAGPALVLVSLGARYGLGLDAPWYLLALLSVGYVKGTSVLIVLAGAGAAGQLAASAAGRYAPYPPPGERAPYGAVRTVLRPVLRTVFAQARLTARRRRARSRGI